MEFGGFLLYLAFSTSAASAILFIFSVSKADERTAKAAELLLYSSLSATTAALLILAYYFVTDNFSLFYVYANSHRPMPVLYKVSAVWAGREGSLLLWSFFTLAASAVYVSRSEKDEGVAKAAAVMSAISAYILAINCFASNPFVTLNFTPSDGVGLNPLLRTPEMVLHPPVVFLGYAFAALPYALYIAGKRKDAVIYARYAWLFLTLGIVIGGWWAYRTLGWGGFWGWDPVENASLLPWLALTAFFHSTGRIKELFAYVSYVLVVFATFLTRSGVIKSVHTFGESASGWLFLVFIFATMAALLKLRGEGRGKRWYYYVPYLLAAGIIAVLLGTISNIFVSVERMYYLYTFTPVFALIAVLIVLNIRRFNTRHLLIHLGVLALFVGATSVWFFEKSYELHLDPSDEAAGMKLTLLDVWVSEDAEKFTVHSKVRVGDIGTVSPKMYVYKIERQERSISSVETISYPWQDYYVAVKSFSEDFKSAVVDFYIVPLISLVWAGSAMLVAGMVYVSTRK